MKLPNADRAVIDGRKLTDYVLSHEHPIGRFKARFFAGLGFTAANWRRLDDELRRMAIDEPAEVAQRTTHGQKYVLRGTLTGTSGRSARVVSVWIILSDERIPRFVTVYPES